MEHQNAAAEDTSTQSIITNNAGADVIQTRPPSTRRLAINTHSSHDEPPHLTSDNSHLSEPTMKDKITPFEEHNDLPDHVPHMCGMLYLKIHAGLTDLIWDILKHGARA